VDKPVRQSVLHRPNQAFLAPLRESLMVICLISGLFFFTCNNRLRLRTTLPPLQRKNAMCRCFRRLRYLTNVMLVRYNPSASNYS